MMISYLNLIKNNNNDFFNILLLQKFKPKNYNFKSLYLYL